MRHIPVICSNQRSTVQTSKFESNGSVQHGKFVGFTQRKKRKIKRLYVHGINKKLSSERDMRDFLERNNVKFTYLRYFEREWKRTASAQLNVVDSPDCQADDPYFWPEGIYVRPWLPREIFISEHE